MFDAPESPPARQAHVSEWPETDPHRLTLALAQLPTRLRRACKLFRELTGLTAVISFRSAAQPSEDPGAMLPPVHPLCVAQIHTDVEAPCDEEWQSHIRLSLRSRPCYR